MGRHLRLVRLVFDEVVGWKEDDPVLADEEVGRTGTCALVECASALCTGGMAGEVTG